MTTTLPFKEIAGQPLNGEQTAYLEGLFTGLSNRGLRFGDVVPMPATTPDPNLGELIAEERIKR
ncbi:MAG TPA: NirA family protein, partial [Verrucomicrobiales bacterium]|nr:NirA family protein [Verrucomicrobiales bacterium]